MHHLDISDRAFFGVARNESSTIYWPLRRDFDALFAFTPELIFSETCIESLSVSKRLFHLWIDRDSVFATNGQYELYQEHLT